MKKIESLLELEKLKQSIVDANKEAKSQIKLKQKTRGGMVQGATAAMEAILPGSSFLTGAVASNLPLSIKDYNAVFDASYASKEVESEIEITPQMARFLADDHQIYEAKKSPLDEKDQKKWMMEAKILGAAGLSLWFGHPVGLRTLAKGLKDRAVHYSEMKKEYARISNERDQIANEILGTYLVIESTPGKYVLKRGAWIDMPKLPDSALPAVLTGGTVQPVDYERIIAPKGFSSKIDLSKLPDLPDTSPDLPSH